jgi:hypothetical protein
MDCVARLATKSSALRRQRQGMWTIASVRTTRIADASRSHDPHRPAPTYHRSRATEDIHDIATRPRDKPGSRLLASAPHTVPECCTVPPPTCGRPGTTPGRRGVSKSSILRGSRAVAGPPPACRLCLRPGVRPDSHLLARFGLATVDQPCLTRPMGSASDATCDRHQLRPCRRRPKIRRPAGSSFGPFWRITPGTVGFSSAS